MTDEPHKPHMLQQEPNLEPAHVWPPLLVPQRPLALTLDEGVGFVAVGAVEEEEGFTAEGEVAMLVGAEEGAFTVELVSVDPPVAAPVVA